MVFLKREGHVAFKMNNYLYIAGGIESYVIVIRGVSLSSINIGLFYFFTLFDFS